MDVTTLNIILFVDIIIIFLHEIAQYLFIQVGNYGGGSVYQNSTDVEKI